MVRALGGFGVTKNVAGTENVGDRGAAGINSQGPGWYGNGDAIDFEGTRVIKCNGMKSGSMAATYARNLQFGTALLADHNRVKILDMEDLDGSDNIRFIAKYSSAVQYGFGGDVVYYAGV